MPRASRDSGGWARRSSAQAWQAFEGLRSSSTSHSALPTRRETREANAALHA